MKYIKRILMLPFAWIMWTFYLSIKWIQYGGDLVINGKNSINLKDLESLLRDLNTNVHTLIEETK